MKLPKAKSILRRSRGCPVPDMAPVAGIALSLIGLLLLSADFRGPSRGIVSLEELPYVVGTLCLRDAPQVFIGLDTEGRYSFAASESNLQAATIAEVSRRHKIVFSNSQLAKLKTLPFLATTVEQLPAILSTSAPATLAPAATQPGYLLTEAQVAEFAKTAKLIAPSVVSGPVYFSLLINAAAGASKVMSLLALFRAQGINQFILQTRK